MQNQADTGSESNVTNGQSFGSHPSKPIPEWLKYLWAGIIGFAIGAGIVMALATTVLRDAQKLANDLADEKTKLYSSGTVIFEDLNDGCYQAQSDIPILNGLATIRINGLNVQSPQPGLIPRWYIPANVEPVKIPFNGIAPQTIVTHFPIHNSKLTTTVDQQ